MAYVDALFFVVFRWDARAGIRIICYLFWQLNGSPKTMKKKEPFQTDALLFATAACFATAVHKNSEPLHYDIPAPGKKRRSDAVVNVNRVGYSDILTFWNYKY